MRKIVFSYLKTSVMAVTASLLLLLPVSVQAQAAFKGIPVLLYHYVGEEAPDYPYLNVETSEFSRQMKELRERGYQSVSLADLTSYMKGASVKLPAKPVLITFDDGYEDNYTQAFPVLKQEGFRAAIFMVQRNFDRKNRLSVQQIQEMEQAGIEIGSHTRSHPNLTKLAASELEKEVGQSRRGVERLAGRPIDSFAYPGGFYNLEVLEKTAQSGYAGAFTVLPGVNRPDKDNPYLLRRIPVFSYTDFDAILDRLETTEDASLLDYLD